MTERKDEDQTLGGLAAIAPDARLVREVVEISGQREDDEPAAADERQPERDDAPGTG